MSRTVSFEVPLTSDVRALSPCYTGDKLEAKLQSIRTKLAQHNAVLIAHYYVDEQIQRLAEETGGLVADSLEMARFGQKSEAKTIVVAGVRFMGETAKILSPEKRVLMPTLESTCSLDLSCPAEEFEAFCKEHPERVSVVYANTSAATKAIADWVVTSSIAVEVISHLMDEGKKIIWAPDKYLGNYLQRFTGADMINWQGHCVVHEEFKLNGLLELKEKYPEAAILVHPESPQSVIDMADAVGSTSYLIKAACELPNKQFIVATDNGIFYKMRQRAPNKQFIEAPTTGEGATCQSCAHCPWMEMNHLDNLEQVLDQQNNEILLDPAMIRLAAQSTQKMIDFAGRRKQQH